ncbi:MAG: hypothetical protein HQK79_04345 [Desulfobacterales bacterium]|nr:hypothetical protein [Desulfobacterales bacterium]
MLVIILNAIVENNRDRVILLEEWRHQFVWDLFLPDFGSIVPNFDIIAITNDCSVKDLFEKKNISSIHSNDLSFKDKVFPWINIVTDFFQSNTISYSKYNEIIIISPSKGIVTSERIKYLYSKFKEDTDKITVSCSRLHQNRHLSWLHIFEKNIWKQKISTQENNFNNYFKRSEYLHESIYDHFPDINEIYGSQWLSEIYEADAAIVCLKNMPHILNNIDLKKKWNLIKADFNDCSFIPYLIPIFQLYDCEQIKP